MILYFIVLLVVFFSARVARTRQKMSWLPMALAFISLVLLAGLRDRRVGTDSSGYVWIFQNVFFISDIWHSDVEPVYLMFNVLIRQFTNQYAFLFLSIAAIIVGCFMWSIVRHSSQWDIALFSFVVCGIYTFGFNGIRQGIACAIYSLAIGALKERRLWRYMFIVMIASLFHITILVAIPAYFLIRPGGFTRKYATILIIGIFAVLFFDYFAEMGTEMIKYSDYTIIERYSGYLSSESTAGRYITAFEAVLCFFFFTFRRHVIKNREFYDMFLKMYFLGTTIAIATTILGLNPSGIRRVAGYFTFSIIFLWPLVFQNMQSSKNNQLFRLAFFSCYLVFYAFTIQRFSNLVPYMFNRTLFP